MNIENVIYSFDVQCQFFITTSICTFMDFDCLENVLKYI